MTCKDSIFFEIGVWDVGSLKPLYQYKKLIYTEHRKTKRGHMAS